MITTLLIANRGEIACRVMRTAKSLGIKTVAVHSAIDAHARHVREADIAINLGGAKPAESYLRMDAIIQAAKDSGAQAIHPGYGFLSENAAFASLCEENGLIFIGPPASSITAMGSKSAAKALMEEAGVPLVPGYHGESQDLETFRQAAERIGYPVLLKATAGGGGKGMKVVESEKNLAEALASAQREALSGFGDARMLVEKYVLKPRHVEIQVFADQHQNCLYLNERDCSIQRRHQKVVEEAPAPGLSKELRQAMGEAAVKAAKTIGYVGAGTVEFLLDARGEFFFMEMNTRLQVEHPVTEAITGLDLVALQLRVARGEPLPLTQEQVPLDGHAIEVRLYAEDTDQDFLPASGDLRLYREPVLGDGQRIDSGVEEGDSVSPFYDPMISKLIAWGQDREEARLRLLSLVNGMAVGGFKTNLGFLKQILQHPAFAAEELDTGFIGRYAADLIPPPSERPAAFWNAAAHAYLSTAGKNPSEDVYSPWSSVQGWRAGLPASASIVLACEGEIRRVTLGSVEDDASAKVAEPIRTIRKGNEVFVEWNTQWISVTRYDPIEGANAGASHQGGTTAPMNGVVVSILVEPGQKVESGATLVVLEAMKMEHSIRAPREGTVKSLLCSVGELINEGAVLFELEEIA